MTIVAVRPNVAISTIPNRDARARIFIAGPFANTSPDNERLPEAAPARPLRPRVNLPDQSRAGKGVVRLIRGRWEVSGISG